MTDEKLIRQYVAGGSEEAFQQIVSRYLKMVYATCLREVQNPDLAQDVTQIVFVLLAQKARRLRPGTVLSGWLFTTAQFAGKAARRREYRRRQYEMRAMAEMPSYTDRSEPEATAVVIEIWLNEALSRLKADDRDALLLRYAKERSLNEIAARYGISENGAHKRVTRALERLRQGLQRLGNDSEIIANADKTSVLPAALTILLAGSSLLLPPTLSAAAISQAIPSVLAGTAGAAIAGERLIQLSQSVSQAIRAQQMKIAAIVLAGCLTVAGMVAAGVRSAFPPHMAALVASEPASTVYGPASAAYAVTDLGMLTGFTNSTARSINNKGEIVGGVWTVDGGPIRAFDFHDELMHGIPVPPGYKAYWAQRINDQGTILGLAWRQSHRGDIQNLPLVGTKDDLSIDTRLGSLEHLFSNAINDKGSIVGWYSGRAAANQVPTVGFVLSEGKLQPISTPSDTMVIARGINNKGQIVGLIIREGDFQNRVGIYSNGQMTILPDVRGYFGNIPNHINDHGDVTGCLSKINPSEHTAYLYRNGSITNLGTIAGFSDSEGTAINAAGTVVGYVEKRTPSPPYYLTHAVLFTDGHPIDLNTLIDPTAGWELERTVGINDKGQIIGNGRHNGAHRAFLLTPKI